MTMHPLLDESRKNGTRKIGPRKIGPRKNGPRKSGLRETQKRKIVRWASSIVVCVWNVEMLSIYENPKLDNKHKIRKQTQNSETKNCGVSFEHRGVCVWNVRMWSIYENPQLDNKSSWTTLVFYSLVHM